MSTEGHADLIPANASKTTLEAQPVAGLGRVGKVLECNRNFTRRLPLTQSGVSSDRFSLPTWSLSISCLGM